MNNRIPYDLKISSISFVTGFFLTSLILISNKNKKNNSEQIIKKKDFTIINEFNNLEKDFLNIKHQSEDLFPKFHQKNYVVTGYFFNSGLITLKNVFFFNNKKKSMVSFYHLTKKSVNLKPSSLKFILSTIIDESMCLLGFKYLPSKKGVTGSLEINFEDVQPSEYLILKTNVVRCKGRKIEVKGVLELITFSPDERRKKIAEALAILIEPYWFKYLRFLKII